jgi:hypothetical protein
MTCTQGFHEVLLIVLGLSYPKCLPGKRGKLEHRNKLWERWQRHLIKLKLNSVALVRERPPLVGEVVPPFADRGCREVSAADSHGH